MSRESADPFVGRSNELNDLKQLLLRGINGHGGLIFIIGEPGEGKTELVHALEMAATSDDRLREAKFLTATCFQNCENDPYHPLAEIVRGLRPSGSDGHHWRRKTWNIFKETAPEVVNIFAPGMGTAVKMVKTGVAAVYHGGGDEKYANLTNTLDDQFTKALVRTKEVFPLLVLVIEDCQWIDQSSCRLLFHLAGTIIDQHVVIIATSISGLSSEHPFHHLMSQLTSDSRETPIASVINLSGLQKEDIERYIRERFNDPLNAELAGWLQYLGKGNPLIVSQYLSLLEQANIIRHEGTKSIFDGEIRFLPDTGKWNVSESLNALGVPDSIGAVLSGRVELLPEETRHMLKIAAVQGERFMSTILSYCMSTGLGDYHEKRILMELGPVIERHRLIRISETGDDEWAARRAAVYTFDHALLHQQFYKQLNRREREIYHRDVADSLEKAIGDKVETPSKILLDVANHADQGGNLALAASYYDKAAQSSFLSGAVAETVQLCKLALDRVRKIESNPVNDKLHARIILLLLSASELWWRGGQESRKGSLPIEEYVAEAEKTATSSGDEVLLSQAKFLKGKILISIGSHIDGIEALQDALDSARRAGDSFGELMIMSELGHHRVVFDMNKGIKTLYEAHDLFGARVANFGISPERPILDREFLQLKGRIGVAEFDRGNLGEAVRWLEESTQGLESLKASFELAWMLNFLGQVYTTTGSFEEAEDAFRKAVELHKEEKPPVAVRGYTLTELGKLYLEWGRVHEAVEPMTNGWKETLEAGNVAVMPLARNYYAELLMQPEPEIRNQRLAEQEIENALKEARKYELPRSAIVALSLWGQLSLMKGDLTNALLHSTEAVHELETRGKQPHVRPEEILFNQYLVLKATDQMKEAQTYLERSLQVLLERADSIHDKKSHDSFLNRVPLSQRILTATASIPLASA